LFVGSLIGICASYLPRFFDRIVQRITELLMAFPEFLIALVVVAILGRGSSSIALGVTTAMVPAYIRMSRVLSGQIRNSEFLLASRVLGVPQYRAVFRHVLPNVLSQLLILAIIGFGTAITTTAGLSFLGLGLQPPAPEWGVIMNEGRNQLHQAWWITVSAGLTLTLTIMSVTVLARYLQQRISGVKLT
ncbi:MAG: ABC transporter permease, partial [Microbacteriaceae bacterium]